VEELALYSRFNFFLESDATYTLDEALKELQEVRDYEKLPPGQQQTQEALQNHRQRGTLLWACLT